MNAVFQVIFIFQNFAVSISPEPSFSWYRDDTPVEENERYRVAKENLGICHLDVQKLEFADQVSVLSRLRKRYNN